MNLRVAPIIPIMVIDLLAKRIYLISSTITSLSSTDLEVSANSTKYRSYALENLKRSPTAWLEFRYP